MPNDQALQVFYGTIPLILIIAAYFTREQMLLKDILERLRNIETWMPKVVSRLATLESRAGFVYHEEPH